MTNSLALVILVTTNWVQFNNDWKRESGTNYVKRQQVVSTNTWLVETRICVTSNMVHQAQSTNGPVRWEAVGPFAVPPLPGATSKE